MADDFFELYRRPEWQKKRLEIMQAADFSCQECGNNTVTLNVHHRHYVKGAKPWEYKNHALVCLCEPCHKRRHNLVTRLKEVSGWLSEPMLERLIGYAGALVLKETSNVRFIVGNDTECLGLADAYRVSCQSVVNGRDKEGCVDDLILVAIRESILAPQQG